MYDRRISGWVTLNAYLFDVIWDDSLASVAQVNPEFGDVASAIVEAEKYAFLIGQLPACLREDVNEIWIHQGVELFGGGTNSILIHTGQSINYENDGIIEETLVHEASHTSLDRNHATSSGWRQVQNLDNQYISTYARDNPTREDVAESFLTWLATRFRSQRISALDYNNITQAIPNRLNYFDLVNCDLYPLEKNPLGLNSPQTKKFKIYPNPTSDIIHVEGNDLNKDDIRIYSLSGQDFNHLTSNEGNEIDVSKLPVGYYILKVKSLTYAIYKCSIH